MSVLRPGVIKQTNLRDWYQNMSQDVNFDISDDIKEIKVRAFKPQILLYSHVTITLAGYCFQNGAKETRPYGNEIMP